VSATVRLLCPTTNLVFEVPHDQLHLYTLQGGQGITLAAARCACCDASMRPSWHPDYTRDEPQVHGYIRDTDGAFVLARKTEEGAP